MRLKVQCITKAASAVSYSKNLYYGIQSGVLMDKFAVGTEKIVRRSFQRFNETG